MTFGFAHRHPTTGESLAGCFVRIPGDYDQARHEMNRLFGRTWSMQYPNEQLAGVYKYDLREIPLPEHSVIEGGDR